MGALPQLQSPRKTDDSRERNLREAQVREAQNMETLGRMVGGVAHDFNNLLTGIVLCCDLLLAKMERTSQLRRYAEDIRLAGTQGAALIQQLLSVTRQRSVELRVLNLNQVVEGLRNLLVRLIGENIELTLELAGDLRPVNVDPTQLQQVVLNLVLNARDAMPDGGRIRLSTRNLTQGSLVEIAVEDSGCGMTQETISRIFDPFFTTKTTGRGNGLGLATVRAVVRQYGGAIQVESEPGKGSKFSIRLPQCEGADTSEFIRGRSL